MMSLSKWKRSIDLVQGPRFENVNPYDQDDTQNIRIAVLRGPWHPKIANYLARKTIKGLDLYRGNGFTCENYDFLSSLDHLELLSIMPDPYDYAGNIPISELTQLKRLSAPYKHRQPLDFTKLSKLQSCTINWNKKVHSIFQSKSLKRLQLSSLNWQHTDDLANLRSLENLEIAHSGIRAFEPIRHLTNLKRLSLQVCHSLENLSGIEDLQNLKLLSLSEVNKITSLECLTPLKNLEALTISDARDIESVAPLEELKNLRAIWIAGTKTNIVDGDLTPLTKLPKLAMLLATGDTIPIV